MNRNLLLWSAFLYEMEPLFKPFNLNCQPIWKKVFNDSSPQTYTDFIKKTQNILGHSPSPPNNNSNPDIYLHLTPIFSNISISDSNISEKSIPPYLFPIKPLSESKEIFPEKSDPINLNTNSNGYKNYLNRFLKELESYVNLFPTGAIPDFEPFFYLAQKYLWCIANPSSNSYTLSPQNLINKNHMPNPIANDISIFQIMKTSAAATSILCKSPNEISEKPFAVIGFDISGIQDYIYTITTKSASKSLKGRSFFLQLLEMAITRYLLDCFELSAVNVIYNGGGKGFILTPTPPPNSLDAIEKEINTYLFDESDTRLFVGLSYSTFEPDQFKAFNKVLESVFTSLEKKKKQKFAAILKDKYKRLFNPKVSSDELKDSCSICGKEGKPEFTKDDLNLCSHCANVKEIGEDLRKAVAILEPRGNIKPINSNLSKESNESPTLSSFKAHIEAYKLVNAGELDKINGKSDFFIYYLNDTEKFLESCSNHRASGYLFFAGNHMPSKPYMDEPADFNDIADASNGAKKLGVIRGDVDNLSTIFASGLGESVSIERISQLSFLMKHFFSSLIHLYFKEENMEYIIYSGGDDFFIVGPWDILIDHLIEFRKGFTRFTCKNRAFSFSASFSIFDSHYPAFKFAQIAGDMEHNAKEWTDPKKPTIQTKNNICFLGKVVAWNDFFHLKKLQQNLVELIENGTISRSYIQLLQNIAQYNSFGKFKPKTDAELARSARFHRWKWFYSWQAARLLERKKNNKEIKETIKALLEQIEDFLFNSNYDGYSFINKDALYLIELPARWTELKTKDQKPSNSTIKEDKYGR